MTIRDRLRCRSRASLIAFLNVAVAMTACSSGEREAEAGTVPRGTPLTIEQAATISLGLVSGDTLQEFDRVVTPFLLPDGRVVVPLAGANSIRVFGPDGKFIRSLGRAGSGPGEFRSLYKVWHRADTIEAFDVRLNRITRFLPDGSTQVVSLKSVLRDLSAVAGPIPDGWIVGGVASAGDGRRDTIVVHRFARTGEDLGEVARVAGFARYAGGGFARGPEPLSPRAVLAVNHAQVYVAETLTPRIRVLDPTGTLKHEVNWEISDPTSVSDAYRVVVDSAVARSPADRAAATRQQLEAAKLPEQMSAFWGFIIDEQGFIWVRPYEPIRHAAALGGLGTVGPGGRWLIFSPDGAKVGFVELPAELEPFHITSNAVVGISRDAFGVESVRVHSLQRK